MATSAISRRRKGRRPEHGFRTRYALVEKQEAHGCDHGPPKTPTRYCWLPTRTAKGSYRPALSEILKSKKSLKSRPVKRVVFYEITESAVKEGVSHPRSISMPLVNTQARRA